MKLQLSVWAENLPKSIGSSSGSSSCCNKNDEEDNDTGMGGADLPSCFAVVTVIRKDDPTPVLLGKTETIAHSVSPDWTKMFKISDYELGSELHLAVSVYNSNANNECFGSAIFEVGALLGSKGSILGQELKCGGIVVASLESAEGIMNQGTLFFQLQALGLMGGSHAFFELQRLRSSVSRGVRVWDTVFRSSPVQSGAAVWGESYLELSALCGSNLTQQFRLAVFDYKKDGQHELLGDVKLTLYELKDAVSPDGNDYKALKLNKSGELAGDIIVIKADVTMPEGGVVSDDEDQEQDPGGERIIAPVADEYFMASESEEIVIEPFDVKAMIAPTFANFVKGGCELHVMVAIDATASNGDPRKPDSLHSFIAQENNYQKALAETCQLLSKYDSDQLFPVYGFGAKRDGQVSQCFSLTSSDNNCDNEQPAKGVDGILVAYDRAFKAGMTMSSPRDFSQVVTKCASKAKEELDRGHAYSILLLFTNGTPADLSATLNAFQNDAADAPLSTVIIGIGNGDFSEMTSLESEANSHRDQVRFVQYEADPSKLSTAALNDIPKQLEAYFKERNIYPNPEQDPDDIAITPFNQAMDVDMPIQITPNGDPVVTGRVDTATLQNNTNQADQQQQQQQTATTTQGGWRGSMNQAMAVGQQFLQKHQKQVGNIRRKFNNEARKEIKKRFPQAKFLL